MSEGAGDDRSRLLRALALSKRFHLYVAYCESPHAAEQFVEALRWNLPQMRNAKVSVRHLDPYEYTTDDAPLSDKELIDRILIPLLSPASEWRARGVVHVVDASHASPVDISAWQKLFALWNEQRNALRQHNGEILVVLPKFLERPFTTSAPDVWSIRSGEYRIADDVAPGAARLAWYAAIPPLALFGGDLVVRPWLKNMGFDPKATELLRDDSTDVASDRANGVAAQRALRRAEGALREGRFVEAEKALSPLVHYPERNLRKRADEALCTVLAALDRWPEALSMHDSTKDAKVYATWCSGRLSELGDVQGRRTSSDETRSQMLRSVEQGALVSHPRLESILHYHRTRFDELEDQVIYLNSHFFAYTFYQILGMMEGVDSDQPESYWDNDEDIAAGIRYVTVVGLSFLAWGDRRRAVAVLDQRRPSFQKCESDMVGRIAALRAYAWGLVQAQGQNPKGAAVAFARAQVHIAAWAETGFDRRSLHRASLAVDLALATLDQSPSDPIATARTLVERADTLLGPTAEDCIARILAVETRRELARRLFLAGDPTAAAEARAAAEMARPLAGRGAPAWDHLVKETEHHAAAY